MMDTMLQKILEELKTTSNPTEKAAIIADFIFDELPNEVALAARRCIILHWFDQSVVEALLQDTHLSQSKMRKVYEQLASLSFVEKLPWGLAFQDLTREGLLKRYASTHPELLMSSARLAASAYETRKDDEKVCAEALFCYIVAGDRVSFNRLLNELLERKSTSGDSLSIDNLLQLQEEAKKFSFVKFFPLIKDGGQQSSVSISHRETVNYTRAAKSASLETAVVDPLPTEAIEAVARLHLYIDKQLSVEEMAVVQQILLNHPEIESRFHFDMKIKHLIHERCIIERAPAHLREAVLRMARTPIGQPIDFDSELEMEIRADLDEINELM